MGDTPGSGLGLQGISPAVAVEFDTYKDPGDISDNHVSFISDSATKTQTKVNLDLNSGSVYHAWVDYNGVSDSLAVYLSNSLTKPLYLLLETTIDLEAVVGPKVYFGFTAATGARINAHQILSWQLDLVAPPLDPPSEPDLKISPVDLITNIDRPTAVDWLPDGTMIIALQSGVVRVASGSTLLPTPFIDISNIVNGVRDRGLLDIAVHPRFDITPFVYLLFTYEGVEPENNNNTGYAGPDGIGNRAGRLIRVNASVSNNYLTAVPGSEFILLGKNSTRAYFNAFADSTTDFDERPGGQLNNGDYVQDFINSDRYVFNFAVFTDYLEFTYYQKTALHITLFLHISYSQSHTIGGLVFSPDGSALYISTGDGASYNQVDVRADRVQDINSLSGKVLRIDPITGKGLPSNPFYGLTNDADANSAKVYQLGLRNPFRISVDSTTGQLYIGDVGWTSWEEVNSAGPGANFGWPFYEGGNGISLSQMAYSETPEGAAFLKKNVSVVASIYALNHQSDGINAIVLGAKLSSTYYGTKYQGNLFLNDLGQGIVRHMSFDTSGNVANVDVFTTGAMLFVDLAEGPDGLLYYCALGADKVGRWELR
jgi:glucose/arabinose dehydrogenase